MALNGQYCADVPLRNYLLTQPNRHPEKGPLPSLDPTLRLATTTTTTVASGQSNLTTGRIAAAHGVFSGIARWRQCAPPPNTCFLGPT